MKYGIAALDPYFLSLNILVERFCMEIGNLTDGGLITAERRGYKLDAALELAWLTLKNKGTPLNKGVAISYAYKIINV